MLRTSFGKFAAVGVLALSGAVHAENIVKRFLRPNTRVGFSVPFHTAGASSPDAWLCPPWQGETVPFSLKSLKSFTFALYAKRPVVWSWCSDGFVQYDVAALAPGTARLAATTADNEALSHTGLGAISTGLSVTPSILSSVKFSSSVTFSGFIGAAAIKEDFFKTWPGLHALAGGSAAFNYKGVHQVEFTGRIFPKCNSKQWLSSNYAPFYTFGVGYSHTV